MYLPGNFIAQRFAGNDGDFLAYPFISVKVQSKTWIVFLNNELRGLFDRLRSDTTLKSYKKKNKSII